MIEIVNIEKKTYEIRGTVWKLRQEDDGDG